MDRTRALTLFLAVVRAGSFSRAAVEAGLTPQAMSKAVRQLEAHLNVRLLHRTTRKLSLTDEGSRLFELADPGMRMLDDAVDQVHASREAAGGTVRVAAPPSLGGKLLVPLMRDYQKLHPSMRFDVLLDDRFTDLVEARVDVGFRIGTSAERNVIARKLRDVRLVICAAPAYIEENGKPASLAQLLKHRCTGFRHPNTGKTLPWELQKGSEIVYQEVPAVATFNDVATEVEAVRNGIGIGQLATYMIQQDLDDGSLVPLLPQLSSARLSVFMYYPQRTQMPSRVRRFVDFVIEASRP
ncbi:LysR family transcriptional regulator [Paraburkholderia rhizosphaerae]|uniref:DNA-binding transcriptional LysR family regulator n=1 Tax=Paraburkholderia rhizosphaerae TaxID=480658 RepID=A0A4R8LH34_9BURK|nr:LysR family transcriptional regulator [Paraburkholderia rhizosphaerae]TDY42486.1 DNA-binding transcriptional LysR family regulator [Paraburkholderia rhizosphaerae]